MNEAVQFLIHHGYAVIFPWVLAEQIGMPAPSAPLLFAVGALAGQGLLNFTLAFILAVVAAVTSNLLWYLHFSIQIQI
jgi:membrane protein DedA with SNARE-associated domain